MDLLDLLRKFYDRPSVAAAIGATVIGLVVGFTDCLLRERGSGRCFLSLPGQGSLPGGLAWAAIAGLGIYTLTRLRKRLRLRGGETSEPPQVT